MTGLEFSFLYTLSGLLFIGAAVVYIFDRMAIGATLLVVAGSGGLDMALAGGVPGRASRCRSQPS